MNLLTHAVFQVFPDISRINIYGSQADCVTKTHPDLRKYCMCKPNTQKTQSHKQVPSQRKLKRDEGWDRFIKIGRLNITVFCSSMCTWLVWCKREPACDTSYSKSKECGALDSPERKETADLRPKNALHLLMGTCPLWIQSIVRPFPLWSGVSEWIMPLLHTTPFCLLCGHMENQAIILNTPHSYCPAVWNELCVLHKKKFKIPCVRAKTQHKPLWKAQTYLLLVSLSKLECLWRNIWGDNSDGC